MINNFLIIFLFFPLKEIIPQLFARLSSHPEQVVRQQLESLLVMLAKLAPWSVVYPTLVDANTHEKEPSGELRQILACLVKATVSFSYFQFCTHKLSQSVLISCSFYLFPFS